MPIKWPFMFKGVEGVSRKFYNILPLYLLNSVSEFLNIKLFPGEEVLHQHSPTDSVFGLKYSLYPLMKN